MGRTSARRVLVARVCGSADAYAQHRRLTADEALAEIRVRVSKLDADSRQWVLDAAAARYAQPEGEPEWYFSSAFELLVRAGADGDRAAAIRAARPEVRGLGGLGEQGR